MECVEQAVTVRLARQPTFPVHLHIAVDTGRRRQLLGLGIVLWIDIVAGVHSGLDMYPIKSHIKVTIENPFFETSFFETKRSIF